MSINEDSTSTYVNNDSHFPQNQHHLTHAREENSNAIQIKANDYAEDVASSSLAENQIRDDMQTRKRSRSIISTDSSEKSRQSFGNSSHVHHTKDCGSNRFYNFRPIQTNTIRFRVQARNDVSICLSPDDQEQPEDMYEVFIGGWGGTASAIRRKKDKDVYKVETPDIVCADEMRGFWINISHGVIKVGREGEHQPFMSYTDQETLLYVSHYGFCTAYGSEGDWTFSAPSTGPGPSIWLNTNEKTSDADVDATDTDQLLEESRSSDKDVSADDRIKLKKSMTLIDGVGIIVGVMIGSGIFVSPKGVLQYSGSVGMALCVWGISGIFVLIGAICYAELGTMIPLSGGDYVYIGEAFGPLPAFLYLWVSLLIIQPTSNAVIALAFANYIIYPWFHACAHSPDIPIKLIASALTCFLTWINCVSTRVSLKMQDFLTLAKVGALIMIIGAGIYHLATGNTQNFQNPFEATHWEAASIATAFYQGLFSFAGWNCLNFVTEELQDPYRNLPRAILISIPVVLIVYFFTNVAYFAVLTPAEIMTDDAVAVNFGERMLGVMHWTMPIFVACATFSSLNGCIFSGARILYSSAREGHLPDVLGLISIRHFTPVPSLIILMVMTLAYMVTSDIQLLINYVTYSESLFITASIAALIWLRIKQPNRHRPIKVWIIFPIIFFLVCLFLVIFPVIENPIELGIASAIILSGVPVYYLCIRPSACCNGITDRVTWVCQLLVEGLPEEDEIKSETISTGS